MNELSVIVPCVSRTDALPYFIDKMASRLMANPSDVDLIVVANERTEDPDSIAKYVQEKYPWLKFQLLQRKGGSGRYGALVRFGLAHSTSRHAVLVSPYDEDDIQVIFEMLKKVRGGAQVVQATRFSTPEDAKALSLRFRSYQKLYRGLVRSMTGVRMTDSTYGFKMFDRTFVQALGLSNNGYGICPEITLKSILAGGKVEYLPTKMTTSSKNKDFSLRREGTGYVWVLLRSAAHRAGISWF